MENTQETRVLETILVCTSNVTNTGIESLDIELIF